MNGVCSLREATYCSNPFEIFYEKNNLVLLVSKKRFTPLLQFNGCWSLIEFLFFFWVNNEFHSSTQVEIKLFQLKEIQILWELLEMQMHYGQFWIQKEAKNAAKMLKKNFQIGVVQLIAIQYWGLKDHQNVSTNLTVWLGIAIIFLGLKTAYCEMQKFWVPKDIYIYLLRKDTKVTIYYDACLYLM